MKIRNHFPSLRRNSWAQLSPQRQLLKFLCQSGCRWGGFLIFSFSTNNGLLRQKHTSHRQSQPGASVVAPPPATSSLELDIAISTACGQTKKGESWLWEFALTLLPSSKFLESPTNNLKALLFEELECVPQRVKASPSM